MFSPNAFTIIGLILGLISIRTLITTIRNWHVLFDAHFTPSDRQHLSEVAFFLLLPISVMLHEAGHAVAVLLFHGTITGFGWYFFYGFVEYVGRYTPAEIFWIALAGNLVSIVLGLLALALPVIRPFRPSINYLLFVFGAINLLNALVFYPVLDLAGNFVGDWSQIYSGRTPVLSTVTGVIHVGLVLAAFVLWRGSWAKRLFAIRTGLPAHALRALSPLEAGRELLDAAEHAVERWGRPVRIVSESPSGATGISLHWTSEGYSRVIGAFAVLEGHRLVQLVGGARELRPGGSTRQETLATLEGMPFPEQLAARLLDALATVDTWSEPREQLTVQRTTEG